MLPRWLSGLNRGELLMTGGLAFTLVMVVLARVTVYDDSFYVFAYLAITGVVFTLMGIPLALVERSDRWFAGDPDADPDANGN